MISAEELPEASPFKLIAALLAEGESVCLLVVVETSGSVPQKANACALVDGSGLLWGTIGGGRLEGDAIAAARAALLSGDVFLLEVDLAEDYTREAGPICGGRMKIFGRPMKGGDLPIVQTLAEKTDGFACLSISGDHSGRIRWSGEGLREQGTYSLPLRQPPKLIVVGAGHCGRAIAELGCWLGFATTVLDERDDLLDRAAFPQAAELITTEIAAFPEAVEIDANSFIALVSMGHRSDAEALEACLGSEAAYIGMIGSRRKIRLLKRYFISEGIATESQWESLSTPIGLRIGAKTVREIALSVMGEIVERLRRTR